MEKTFYTQEGSIYILKVASQVTLNNTPLQPYFVTPKIRINLPDPPFDPAFFNTLRLETTKKIIPLSCSLGYLNDSTLQADVDITSTYYQLFRNDLITTAPAPGYDHISALNKLIPLTDKVYFSDEKQYQFNVKYNDAVLSDFDFIDFSVPSTLVFVPQIAFANINSTNFEGPSGQILLYDVAINLTYFELQ